MGVTSFAPLPKKACEMSRCRFLMGVTEKLHKSYKKATKKLQESHKNVTRKSQNCHMKNFTRNAWESHEK
jgi:hypothetical protein